MKEEGLKTRKGAAGNEVRRENRVKKQGSSVGRRRRRKRRQGPKKIWVVVRFFDGDFAEVSDPSSQACT